MRLLRRVTKQDIYELEDLEDYLARALRPVEPRPGFIADLRARLDRAPAPQKQSPAALRYALLAAAGLLSSLIIVITGVRAAITILGALGVLGHVRNQARRKQVAAAPPVI
ncbi:MAG: hypothetical protein JXA78_16005 [Anaerolineales bacterium]|nr:hypothetical protein [Anaerolineales bacterium]